MRFILIISSFLLFQPYVSHSSEIEESLLKKSASLYGYKSPLEINNTFDKKKSNLGEKLFKRSNESVKDKLIMRNIYLSSSFYFFNLLFILTELLS